MRWPSATNTSGLGASQISSFLPDLDTPALLDSSGAQEDEGDAHRAAPATCTGTPPALGAGCGRRRCSLGDTHSTTGYWSPYGRACGEPPQAAVVPAESASRPIRGTRRAGSTRTSTDPAHRSRRAPGVPRLGASSRVSPSGGGGGEARRRGGATAGGLKAYRSYPRPYAATSTEAVPLDHDASEPPDPGRRAPQGHHVEAGALVDCRPLRLGRTPVCGTVSGASEGPDAWASGVRWGRARPSKR
jgi:hypothetical protein